MKASHWYTVKEIAEIYGSTPKVITKRCQEGFFLGAKKEGREWNIPHTKEIATAIKEKTKRDTTIRVGEVPDNKSAHLAIDDEQIQLQAAIEPDIEIEVTEDTPWRAFPGWPVWDIGKVCSVFPQSLWAGIHADAKDIEARASDRQWQKWVDEVKRNGRVAVKDARQ